MTQLLYPIHVCEKPTASQLAWSVEVLDAHALSRFNQRRTLAHVLCGPKSMEALGSLWKHGKRFWDRAPSEQLS